MSKSVLYASNTSAQSTTATGTVLNFGTVVRKYGCNLDLVGGNAVSSGVGYYDTNVSVTFTASGTGTETLQVYKDGVAITGAEATVTTAADTTYTVNIPCVLRNTCCCDSTITVVASGVAGSVANSAIVVERI